MTPTTPATVFIFSTVPGRMPNFSAIAGAVTLEPLFTMPGIKPEHQQTVQDGDSALPPKFTTEDLLPSCFLFLMDDTSKSIKKGKFPVMLLRFDSRAWRSPPHPAESRAKGHHVLHGLIGVVACKENVVHTQHILGTAEEASGDILPLVVTQMLC